MNWCQMLTTFFFSYTIITNNVGIISFTQKCYVNWKFNKIFRVVQQCLICDLEKCFSHPSLIIYFFQPTHKTKSNATNRWETINSKPYGGQNLFKVYNLGQKGDIIVPLPFWHKLKKNLFHRTFEKLFIICAKIIINWKFRLSSFEP